MASSTVVLLISEVQSVSAKKTKELTYSFTLKKIAPMRQTLSFILLLSFVALLNSGCASRNPKPNPASTRLGDSASQIDKGWIEDESVYVGGEALPERDVILPGGDDQGAGGANGLTGINPNAVAVVYFGFDQSAIAPAEREKLKDVASQMRANPQLRVLVEGRCDWRGTVEYNLALGERRAKSVVDYLSNLGIAPNRFETLSKGDLDAIVQGTAEQMAQDRRAEIIPLR